MCVCGDFECKGIKEICERPGCCGGSNSLVAMSASARHTRFESLSCQFFSLSSFLYEQVELHKTLQTINYNNYNRDAIHFCILQPVRSMHIFGLFKY